MSKFRKKPVVIEAVQFPGTDDPELFAERGLEMRELGVRGRYVGNSLRILTAKGEMTANPGDWVIKGVNGEFYPCKPDIFEKTYEAVK